MLIAAGDIHDPLSEGVRWLADRAAGRPVIYVPGNHEWYAYRQSFTMSEESKRGQDLADRLGIHLLQDAEIIIDGVRFLGSTLWTDYALDGNPAAAMRYAQRAMNDHRMIFPNELGQPFTPEDALRYHKHSLVWLGEALRMPFNGTTVVVTHHLPHPKSVHPGYAGDLLNPAFCSDLLGLVEGSGAALWVHGHTHGVADMSIAATFARERWARLSGLAPLSKLRVRLDNELTAMDAAVRARNVTQARAAAKAELAMVDELEAAFAKP